MSDVKSESLDAHHEARIRAKVDDLNAAIVAANSHGLHVNLGITREMTSPSYAQVRVVVIERPILWEAERGEG